MKTILSTKKLKKADKERLSDAGFSVVEKKFIKTKAINFQVASLNEYIIFTSKNAVKSVLKSSIGKQIRDKKIICVGQKTRDFLRKNNFSVEENADYAINLGEIIKRTYKDNSFTFFSGNIRRNTLPDLLNENSIKWNEVIVYETTLNPKEIKENSDGILFFSPSAIESYLTKNKIENETCFCIGTTTAKALETKTKNIKIASKPLVESVIDEVIKYYKKND